MRFLLIDRITELIPGKKISAVKNLTLAEEYLADHFPGFPVMPGVLMVEALVQAGGWLIRQTENYAHSTVLLKSAKALKFSNFVSPGKALKIDLEVHAWDGSECTFKATGSIDGASAISGRLTLETLNLADRDPAWATADRLQTEFWRGLAPQLLPAGTLSP
jgi:3-hydroxyacyl-[acyl-carrier-protein] dehydratase